MPVYQYEGQHYDLPDGLTNEQAIAKIESHLGRSQTQSRSAIGDFAEGALGTAAAVGDIAAGLLKIPAQAALAIGGKIADPSQSLQTSWESAGGAMEETFPSFGRNMQDNAGYTAPMKPFELYGEAAQWAAKKASMGNRDVEGALNISANFLPVPFAGKAARGLGKVAETVDPGLRSTKAPQPAPSKAALADILTKPVPEAAAVPAPDITTPISEQLRKNAEAIEALRREQELARQSAFNRPDSLPDLEAQSPMERMARDLGAEPTSEKAPRTAMSDMADTLLEGSTKEQRAAQAALDARQAELELAVKKQSTLDRNASERARQGAAAAVSEAHKAYVQAQEAARIAKDTKRMAEATQPELFEGYDHGYGPNPHDIGGQQHWVLDENGMPIRADLSMEAANLENPLQRNLWGDELLQKHEQEAPVSLTAAIDSMSREQAREGGKFVPGTPKSIATQRLTGNPLPLGSAARRALMKKQGGFLAIDDLLKAGQVKRVGTGMKGMKVYRAVGANEGTAGPRQAGSWVTPNKDIAINVYAKGDASKVVEDYIPQRDLYEAHPEGWIYAPEGTNVENIQRTPTQTFGDLTRPKIPFNFRKQGGGVLIPFGKEKERQTLKGIPGVKDKIGELLPDRRDNETFLKEESSAPDVDQNALQRLANYGTKGSLYQAIKTQNPLVKRVGDRVREANNKARAIIADVVHQKLAPAAQALNKSERTDIMMAMQLAEANGRPLTEQMLREHGYNQKQIDFFNNHTEAMKFALGKMNEAQKIAGEAPVTPRVAYLASRASGDFRRLIYKEVDGERTPVAILGADTRKRLDADVKKLQAEHPEWIVGEEKFYGGGTKARKAEGMSQAIELLARNNPDVKLLADHINDLLTKDAYDYLNAKSHTMAKKGIAGMSGRKMFEDVDTNALEAMQAQVNYVEKIVQWAEMSRAVEDLKPLLRDDNSLKMPNAKEWSKDYIQQALGNNPSKVGQHIDAAFAEFGRRMGIGPSVGGRIVSASRKITNGLLLGFGNIGFLAANMIQPLKSMPEMAAFLTGRGLEKKFDAGTGFRYLGKALDYAWKDLSGKEVPTHIRGALDYAKENHVYSSDLFDASNSVDKGFWHYWDKGTQFGASAVEMRTRQSAYLAYVEMLHENGLTKADGLYEAAQNLTDIQMNNYALSESPKMYNDLGAMGGPAYNLMSYKHNEYSRLAMLVNEMGRSGTAKPLMLNIMASVAFAGLMGTLGYAEADALVKLISKQLGQPTSLTKMLLENPQIPEQLKSGGAANIGLDLSNRLGIGPMIPQHPIDALMPGAGKLVSAGGAVATAVAKPNEYNIKNAIREAAPNSVGGLLDRAWFSGKDARGNELAINRNKGTPSATRNELDKVYKTLGMTGTNEAKQKALNYENDQITRAYTDIRRSLVDKATKEYFMSGRIPADFARKYIAAQGNPDSIQKEIESLVMEQSMDARTAALLRNSMSNSVTATHKILRMVGKE